MYCIFELDWSAFLVVRMVMMTIMLRFLLLAKVLSVSAFFRWLFLVISRVILWLIAVCLLIFNSRSGSDWKASPDMMASCNSSVRKSESRNCCRHCWDGFGILSPPCRIGRALISQSVSEIFWSPVITSTKLRNSSSKCFIWSLTLSRVLRKYFHLFWRIRVYTI